MNDIDDRELCENAVVELSQNLKWGSQRVHNSRNVCRKKDPYCINLIPFQFLTPEINQNIVDLAG